MKRLQYQFILMFSASYFAVAHIVLTFPSARPMAFDFLVNMWTIGPCGVEYNESNAILTNLTSGSDVTVTWHTAYPHLGGIKLQVLDTDGGIVTELTDDEFVSKNDTTSQSYDITIPDDVECDHCYIRILRQASEWKGDKDDGFLFWSCADVSIISVEDECFDGKCLNGGTCDGGECTCMDKYEGDRCEYKNDCSTNEDCSSNGECVTMETDSYPKKQCFCYEGWMGKLCDKESSITEAKLEDTSDYFKLQLYEDPEFTIFWKLLDNDEVEIAFRCKSDTWCAIGWRPLDVSAECKKIDNKFENKENSSKEEAPSDKKRRKRSRYSDTRNRREVVEKRDSKINVIKDLCEAGNVSQAAEWATWSFNYGSVEPENDQPNNETAELEPEPEPESEPEPEPTPEESEDNDVEPEPEPHDDVSLHPMDCTDVIFATAIGNKHRVVDSYTRDRSTPQCDSWYGGGHDLTGASAKREDGILHVRFTRKLSTNDQADHDLTNNDMHLIWARGQTPYMFFHKPFSGLESCKAQDYDFYKLNELKYHGTKPSQRGKQIFNVFDDTKSAGSAQFPPDCTDECDYKLDWKYVKKDDSVKFTIEAKVEEGGWAAVGFSEDTNMANSDAIVGWVEPSSGELTLTDRWLNEESVDGVALDNGPSNLEKIEGSFVDGRIKFSFVRARNTEDKNDLPLTECVYLLYAWGGGMEDGDITKHKHTRVSDEKICIGSGSERLEVPIPLFIVCVFFLITGTTIFQ